MVSGSFSLLCSRFFSPFLHSTGSLSVMGPAASRWISRVLRYSGYRPDCRRFAYRAFTSFGPLFHAVLLALAFFVSVLQPQSRRNAVGLGSSAFARRYLRNHCYFLFLRVLRCFSSPGWLTASRYVSCDTGSPIRISADLRIFAPPRSFSQLVTSFFASGSLGIPHAPFLTSLSGFYNPACGLSLLWVLSLLV